MKPKFRLNRIVTLLFAVYIGIGAAAALAPQAAAASSCAIASLSGGGQSARVAGGFAAPLVAQVKCAGTPTAGESVTFTLPSSGVGASFPGGSITATATTDANGDATSPAITAGSGAGGWTASASIAGAPTVTTTPSALTDPTNSLGTNPVGISCASATHCVMVGHFQDQTHGGLDQPMVETLDNGVWTITTGIAPGGSDDTDLYSVSCVSTTSCVAVGGTYNGTLNQALVETLANGTWTPSIAPNPGGSIDTQFESVSCTAATSCVAVGDYLDGGGQQHELIETLSGSSWAVTTGIDPPGSIEASLISVSCPAAGSCVAIGNYTNGSWHGLIETLSGGSWTATTAADPGVIDTTQLNGVACSSATSCHAVGYYENSGNSTYDAVVYTLANGTWSVTTGIDPSNAGADTQPYAISCSSATNCVMTGLYLDNGSTTHALVESLSGTTWTVATGTDPGSTSSPQLVGVSCGSASSCEAAGDYSSGSSFAEAITLGQLASPTVYFSMTNTAAPITAAATTKTTSTLADMATLTDATVSPAATVISDSDGLTTTSTPAPSTPATLATNNAGYKFAWEWWLLLVILLGYTTYRYIRHAPNHR